ncbi:MAG TPA: D-alanine--D-alanine ligase family protein [Acidobacteriaceae bacterium]|jgi:D-alanine-D-alanine ligase|nr:D-alanine--D-alanine ligase family protein [Acidobacteriaceae bacterium]
MSKPRIGILFGGRSGEHEVSLLSAASVLKAIDRNKYDVQLIGIAKDGRWVTSTDAERLLQSPKPDDHRLRAGDPGATASAAVLEHGNAVVLPPVPAQSKSTNDSLTTLQASAEKSLAVDVIFPVLHGTFGEDGTVQGLLELADIAYVGSGVLGSAAGMDKDVMKRLFIAEKLPITKYVSFLRVEWEKNPKRITRLVETTLRYPVFVKPANLGSSVGISKVHDRKELAPAIELAASYDRKIVIEQGVGGKRGKARELEVAVLGNDDPVASLVGEIIPCKEFYDYDAKYLSEGSEPVIPAKLSKKESKRVQQMAIAAFRACECSGMARVDFLMEPGASTAAKPRKIYINEINTLPGFTAISMYPKLWDASGVPYPDLIDRLIKLAQERHREKHQTHYSR